MRIYLAYLQYKEYNSRHGERHLPYKEMSKTRLFHVNEISWLINNYIIIYHNNSGITVETVYIPISLVLNILY